MLLHQANWFEAQVVVKLLEVLGTGNLLSSVHQYVEPGLPSLSCSDSV